MSQKRSNLFTCTLFLSLLLLSCGERDNALDDFEESRPGSVKAFYAYPSTIRMLGDIVGTENTSSFADIEGARLFIEWKSKDVNSREQFVAVKNQALSQDFEELLSVSSKNSDVTVLISDSNTPVYLLFSLGEDADYILELEGNISMKTLRDIGTLDVENVMDVINLGKPKKDDTPEIQEN